MEPEEEVGSPLRPGRAGRALALMGVSVLAIAVASIGYAHPHLSIGGARQPVSAPGPQATYHVSSLDFVDPATGWVVVELPTHQLALLHTKDGGRSWTTQLTTAGGDAGGYARFFDRLHGVVVLLGPQAVMLRTADGGKTWSRDDLRLGGGDAISARFVDAARGWLLAQAPADMSRAPSEALYRTSDGGATWTGLGSPVVEGDWAFDLVFADSTRGWLYSGSSAAYAYATSDGGTNWRRVVLPAPRGGWPTAPAGANGREHFFVAARPTAGDGVVAVVVPLAPLRVRSANSSVLLGYPPPVVRPYDGAGTIVYQYRTRVDAGPYGSSSFQVAVDSGVGVAGADEVTLGSVDGGDSWRPISTPASGGAVGYAGALDWWWVGADELATTADGGVSWSRIERLGVTEPLAGSLQVLDPDHAWFAAAGGGRPVLETTVDGGHVWTPVSLPPISDLSGAG